MTERELFLTALEIDDPVARAAHLQAACAGDAALLARVRALLASHEGQSRFLNTPVAEQLGNDAPAGTAATLLVGKERPEQPVSDEVSLEYLQPAARPDSLGRLSHYEVLEVLGHGAFGTVLKAFDEKLQRVVAIKVLAPELAATSPARKRFLREARASAAIRHENVVSIHAVDDDPLPYLVMEFIPGRTLQQRLDKQGPLDVQDVLRLGKQIAYGLAAAHARDLIHRDVKPGNILLDTSVNDQVKITDFGLARAADDASVTQSGMIAGTPLYMAPEQALGKQLDQRADLFSLGSVLYQMVSGRPPFRAPTTLAVMKRVAEDMPRPIQEIIPEAPAWLCAIISKLHAKNPDERYSSAKEVGDLLDHCLTELQQGRIPQVAVAEPPREPGSLPPPKPTLAAAKSRSRQPLVTAAAVALILLIGLGISEATGVTKLTATVIRITTGSGTLVIETDDPGISVSIDGEEFVITGGGVQELRLKPGQHKLLASKDGQVVTQELVTITRGGRQVVRVSQETASVPGNTSADPDRRAAEWVLSRGGTVHLNDDGNHVLQVSDLPTETFRLTGFHLRKPEVEEVELHILKDCQHLKRIDLAFTGISDAGLEFVAGRGGQLKTLDLNGTNVTDAGLARLAPCNELTELSLGSPLVTDAGIAKLGNFQQLTNLWLKGDKLTDAVLLSFKDCQNLGMVDVQWTQIGDAGIARLQGCKNLTVLWARHSLVTASGVKELQTALPNCKVDWNDAPQDPDRRAAEWVLSHNGKIQILQGGNIATASDLPSGPIQVTLISLNGYPGDADAGLAHFQGLTHLTALYLGQSPVSDSGLASLADCSSLSVLALDSTRVTDAGLAALKSFPKLQQLSLHNTRLTDAALAHLTERKTLSDLDLSLTGITDAGLARLEVLTNLQFLQLYQTKISDKGVNALAASLPRCKITWDGGVIEPRTAAADPDRRAAEYVLSLGLPVGGGIRVWSHDQDLFIKAAADLPKDPFQLTLVNLRYHRGVDDAGLAHFQDSKNLTFLNLNGTRVTDTGLAHFKNSKNLKYLLLNGVEVSDAGLETFAGCQRLGFADLKGTKVSEAGVKKLAAALPQCKIEWDGGVIEPGSEKDKSDTP
jgi:Leucine-rich repeat (LRR) protein